MPDNMYFKNNELYKDDALWTGQNPEWVSVGNYSENDIVFYEGVIYISLTSSNQGNQPDISPINWKVFKTGTATANIKNYDFSISGSTVTTINHKEENSDLLVFSRTIDDELILPDVIVLNDSQITVEAGSDYSVIRTNLMALSNKLPNQNIAEGSSIVTHGFLVDNYFVIAKDNSKVAGQLLLPDVMEQSQNSCLLSFSESFGDADLFFINEKDFDKTRDTTVSVLSGASTIRPRHNVGNSDYFVWAIDNDNNKEVILPDVYKMGSRYATLDFDKSYDNLTIYYGGTCQDSMWYTGSGLQTASVETDTEGNEWKIAVTSSGNINTIQVN